MSLKMAFKNLFPYPKWMVVCTPHTAIMLQTRKIPGCFSHFLTQEMYQERVSWSREICGSICFRDDPSLFYTNQFNESLNQVNFVTHSNEKGTLQGETQLRGWRRRVPCARYLALGLLPAEPGFPNCTLRCHPNVSHLNRLRHHSPGPL